MNPNQNSFNPGAYNFVPGGAPSFVPRQDPNAPADQGAYNPYNPYNPYGQQQQQQPGGYGGGYGQYAQQQQGAYGGNGQYGHQQQQPQGGYQGGYPQAGAQGGSYQPPQARQPQARAPQTNSNNTFPAPLPARSIATPPASTGPAKTMSLNIGGAPAAAASSGPAKTMSISIGGKKVATPSTTGDKKAEPAKVLSIGGKSSTAKVMSIGSSATAATPAASDKKEEQTPAATATPAAVAAKDDKPVVPAAASDEKAAEWDEPETAASKDTTESSTTTKVSSAAPNKSSIFTRAAAKTDAEAIAKELARVADADVLQELYGGEEVDPNIKQHLNVVFIGHVDAGKSTMGGQLLYLCDMVDKRTMEKLEKEAKEAGRETWYLSWALDSTPQERAKGKTVEVGRAFFETPVRRYTILDAPGHKTYVPSMISGAAQADVAVLVISARKGEFETGFERGGQTREHAMLVKNNGISTMIVVVNKMDDPTVGWAEERFHEVQSKITPFLRQVGFKPSDLTFIPVSAYTGQNMKERVDKKLAPWSTGPSLLEFLDNMKIEDRKVNAPFVMSVSEKYLELGTMVVGKIDSGRVKKGDTLLMMPNRSSVEVQAVIDEQGEELTVGLCGDNVRIRLKGVETDDVMPGFVLASAIAPISVATQFEAQLAIIDSKNILTAGYSCVMHIHSLAEEVTITALLNYYDKKTGRKSKKPPQFAKKGMRVVARIETSAPICLETFKHLPQMGRFTLRDEGRTIAIGKVTKLLAADNGDVPAIENLTVTDAGGAPAANGA